MSELRFSFGSFTSVAEGLLDVGAKRLNGLMQFSASAGAYLRDWAEASVAQNWWVGRGRAVEHDNFHKQHPVGSSSHAENRQAQNKDDKRVYKGPVASMLDMLHECGQKAARDESVRAVRKISGTVLWCKSLQLGGTRGRL